MPTASSSDAAYQRFAEQLAQMPDVITQLLAAHTSDSTGRCVGCTRPGTGYPAATSPCALRQLAELAAKILYEGAR